MQLALGASESAASAPPAERAMSDYISLIFQHFRPRSDVLPVFADEALGRLSMPLLAIVGARDAMLDSADTAARLARTVPRAEIDLLPGVGHFIPDQTARILEFLLR
jgi:pimeloyl-ACP methyl ester carboxylesterase